MNDHEMRRRRLAELREGQKSAKVLLMFLLIAATVGCIAYVDSLHFHSRKAIAGGVLIAISVPTILLFVFYDRLSALFSRRR